MSFDAMIRKCRQLEGIGEVTEALCDCVRVARNLVHPGREARTGEVVTLAHVHVSAAAAEIVRSVLQSRIGRLRSSPARNLWNAICRNPTLQDTAEDLVLELSKASRREFLLEVLPQEAQEFYPWADDEPLPALARACSITALASASKTLRRQSGTVLVSLLRGQTDYADGMVALESLFVAKHLGDFTARDRRWILSYVVALLRNRKTVYWPVWLEGVGPWLGPEQAEVFTTNLTRSFLSASEERWRTKCSEILTTEAGHMEGSSKQAALDTLDAIIGRCERRGDGRAAGEVAALRFALGPLRDDDIPR